VVEKAMRKHIFYNGMQFLEKHSSLGFTALLGMAAWACCLQPIWDPDSYWHLAMSKQMWATGHLMRTVTFSFENPNAPYADVSWLVHWLYYPIYEIGRYHALEWSVAACGLLTALVLLAAVRINGGSKLAFGLFFGVLFIAFQARMRLRPEMFSLLIFACLVLLLVQYRKGNLKEKWKLLAFPALFLLWGQVHPAWSYGLFLLGSFWLGSFLENREPGARRKLVKDSPFLLFGPAAVVWLSPYGIETALFPIQSLIGFSDTGMVKIEEWSSPRWDLHDAPYWASMLVVFLAYAFKSWRKRKVSMLLFWTGGQCLLQVMWVRYVSFAFIALAPPAVTLLDELLAKVPRLRPALRVAAVMLMIVPIWSGAVHVRTEVDQSINYPVRETDFLLAQSIGGNVLHTFVAGGYLDFRYFPLGRTFFDGRYYPFAQQFEEYETSRQEFGAFESFIEKYPFEVAIMPYPTGLVPISKQGPPRGAMGLILPEKDWAPVYYGPYGAVFLKRLPKYEAAIKEHAYLYLYPDDLLYLKWSIAQGRIKEKDALAEMDRALREGAPVNKWLANAGVK
jgi:hypothetical protein